MITKNSQRILYPVLSILFPCLLGIVGMIRENVPIMIWMQNITVILLAAIVVFGTSKYRVKLNYKIIVFVSILLLGSTFWGPGIEGVHRWLRVPLFTLNISTIVIPITIAALYRLIEEMQFAASLIGIGVIAILLFLQPDAAQLLAFSIPMIAIMLKSKISKIITAGFSVALFLLTLRSWMKLDSLQPVNYTEGILGLLFDTSIILYIWGIIALLWIPVCLFLICQKENRTMCVLITMYYWMMLLATFIGNFPVPFMGYGLSPILGFFIFLKWLL